MGASCVCYILHDDASYLAASVQSFVSAGKAFAFVSRVPWHDAPGDWQAAAQKAADAGAEVVLGEWRSELEHRQFALAFLREKGYTHALIPDGDEIIEPALLHTLAQIASSSLAERVYVHWDTYWKTPAYVIRPRERFTPCLLLDLRAAVPTGLRNFEGGRSLLLPPEYGLVHHLSYVGPDARIRRKLATWGHKNEVVPGWWENVWLHWDADKLLHNLHPTHPDAYAFAERIHAPALLQYEEILNHGEHGGHGEGRTEGKKRRKEEEERDANSSRIPLSSSLSVILPLHGGREDLRLCLDSLEKCREFVSEVVVVDNASLDDAAEEAVGREWVTVLRNEANRGFAAACNQGVEATTGEVILFLNSDTVVPPVGLAWLVQSLRASGSIAAAGPYTNRAGHGQQITPTYTSLDTLDLFAHDFAERQEADTDCDMLVGLCLAVKRSAFVEVGGFDERFGLGTFEDNDLCYRLRRAGYRLVRSSRSFVHHGGSHTFARMQVDMSALLARNQRLFRHKWQEDIECGYASHLSGLSAEPIHFDPARHPDVRTRRIQELARRADISLCMIVKDEARVLGDCLASARPFFREIIVVDTGSTDRTREIAREQGAQVYEFPWTDSFSEARNESLKHARGKWLFWLDADDTLPFASGEAILHAALSAPPHLAGFVVPVQFVDEGTGAEGNGSSGNVNAGGTRVDHVKLFRNRPGIRFEGRIHEQILASLRPHGDIARIPHALVLHSGYDTSPEGQAKKRVRDAKLLHLDLQERPGHPFVLFNLGMTDHYGGEHAGAVEWLRQSIAEAGSGDSHVRKAYALLALSLRQLQRTEESRAVLEEGLAVTPADPELHFHLAHLLTEAGQYVEAEDHYRRVLETDIAAHFSSVDIGILGYKTLHNLGGLVVLQGDYRKAKEWFQKAIDAAPHFLPSAFALFDAALEASDHATARDMLTLVQKREGRSGNWADMGLRYAESVGGAENGWQFLEQAVQQHPHAPAPRLFLARCLLDAGRQNEALPHLHQLDAQGVAEAAFCLGVTCTRVNDLEGALRHMERALRLNPDHAQTREQVSSLRRALGYDAVAVQTDAEGEEGERKDSPASSTRCPAVPLDAALGLLADHFGLEAEALRAYAAEDTVGGYGRGDTTGSNPRWPGGSVWEGEGKALYALARALKPQTIVEVGSLVGCSASHLALACQRNGSGTVYAVDPAADFSRVTPDLLPYIQLVKQDVFLWTPPEQIGLVFEDGAHTPGFTQSVLERLRPHLAANAAVLCHDACQARHGRHILPELRAAMGEAAQAVLIAPSDCGLGYARHGQEKELRTPEAGA